MRSQSRPHGWFPRLAPWSVFAFMLLWMRFSVAAGRWAQLSDVRYFLPVLMVVIGIGLIVLTAESWKTRVLVAAVMSAWLLVSTAAQIYVFHTWSPLQWSHVVVGVSSGFAEVFLSQNVGHSFLWLGVVAPVTIFFLTGRLSHESWRPLQARSKAMLRLAGAALLLGSYWLPHIPSFEPGISRDSVVHLVSTLASAPTRVENDLGSYPLGGLGEPSNRYNVVVVVMESTGYSGTSLGGAVQTTPFLAKQAEQGLQVERAYVAIPHTSKSLVAILCGTVPFGGPLVAESRRGGVPWRCLPHHLGKSGYRSVLFQSATEHFENGRQLANNMGFEEFFSGDQLNKEGFDMANYFGVEDAVLVQPVSDWIRATEEPFFLTVLTNTPHHDYRLDRHYDDYDSHPLRNRWLNAVRYQDDVIRDIVASISPHKRARTIFVYVGDHGEAFGEHRRWNHDSVPWEEVTRVPLVITGPSFKPRTHRLPASQVDIAPTVLDALGALPDPDRRPREWVAGSCFYRAQCLFATDADGYWVSFYDGRRVLRYASGDVGQKAPDSVLAEEGLFTTMTNWRQTVAAGRSLSRVQSE